MTAYSTITIRPISSKDKKVAKVLETILENQCGKEFREYLSILTTAQMDHMVYGHILPATKKRLDLTEKALFRAAKKANG